MKCEYCKAESEGHYMMYRDGFNAGPLIDLCDFCSNEPSLQPEAIWNEIAQRSEHPGAFRRIFGTFNEYVQRIGQDVQRPVKFIMPVFAVQLHNLWRQDVMPSEASRQLRAGMLGANI
jgi:hypothetical protein